MIKISLISLGQTGAGPVYSLEMAKALANSKSCQLQVIISSNVSNLDSWRESFDSSEVDFQIVDTYNHTKLSVFINAFNFIRKYRIVKLIEGFGADILYVPFGLMWGRFIYSFLHGKIKIVTTIHDFTPHDRFNVAEFFSKQLNMGAYHFVDGYVILNNKDRKALESKTNKPVAVIPHASFNYYFNNVNNDYSIKKTIGFFGRIEPYKGLDLLVKAFKLSQIAGLKLIIAGSGSIEKEEREIISKDNCITLINRYIKDEEFQPLLDKVDFVVLPYKRASQSGVIPMCFAYGKTVVATNVGALSEQVPSGTGFIIEPDEEKLANQIDFIYNNPEIIRKYGEAARVYAEKELSWKHSAELLLGFLEKIIVAR